MRFWDVVILTTSSERQVGLYRDDIQRRRLSGTLPEGTQFLVVPDRRGRRVGSGGAAINAILDRARPYIHGAELTGAGGGGFFMLLARDPEAAAALRTSLSRESRERGAFVYYCIAKEGLRICIGGEAAKLPESLSLN